jgi:hypothetical protein
LENKCTERWWHWWQWCVASDFSYDEAIAMDGDTIEIGDGVGIIFGHWDSVKVILHLGQTFVITLTSIVMLMDRNMLFYCWCCNNSVGNSLDIDAENLDYDCNNNSCSLSEQ